MQLTGHLRAAIPRQSDKRGSWSHRGHESYDDNDTYSKRGRRSTRGSIFLPLQIVTSLDLVGRCGEWEQILGLILEKVTQGTKEQTYRRVGVFRHLWGSCYTEKEHAEFFEFIRFDPRNSVREEFTII